MDARFAFTAQHWADGAVVCRATEDRPGPVVEQQFGEFATWTQAQNCATKLNEGLDLNPLEIRQIVTSSFLATASVIQEALDSSHTWTGSRIERETRAAQMRFMLSQLAIGITLCRTVSLMSESESASLPMLANMHKALNDSSRCLKLFAGGDVEFGEIALRAQELAATFQKVISCIPAYLSSAAKK